MSVYSSTSFQTTLTASGASAASQGRHTCSQKWCH